MHYKQITLQFTLKSKKYNKNESFSQLSNTDMIWHIFLIVKPFLSYIYGCSK